jgi:outer membrane receptor protein involved in Fe transport
MTSNVRRFGVSVAAIATALTFSAPAFAQDAPADEEAASEDIVVTGVARGTNRLDASVSTTSLDAETILETAPRSAAELLRNIPGIRAEASGGEGNANINVRGIPVSTGGAKFLQLQEDGLPVLEFGDIIFGNADIFTRVDSTIGRVESIRGGSASTFTSNAPGGIVNFITRDGSENGGQIGLTAGLDYGEWRLDGYTGGAIGPNTRYMVGGFYRWGEGARDAGYRANNGGQIRARITHEFGTAGDITLNFKYLEDRAISYLPSPVRVIGTNNDPRFVAIPGLSPQNETLHSANFRRVRTLGTGNASVINDVADGMNPEVLSLGWEVNLNLAENITLTNRFRYSDIKGRFISPFPSGVDLAQNVANSVGGPGSTLFFATGPNAGQQITNPGTLNGNGLLVPIVLFNTQLDSLDNAVSDTRLNAEFDMGGATVSATAGLYASTQDIKTTWTWTSHILTADGTNADLVDVRNAAGVLQTFNGTVAYGASFFGNCCRRRFFNNYRTLAPFFNLAVEAGPFNIDGSIRLDYGQARGINFADGPVVTRDVNGDGIIQVPETRTTILNGANQSRVNYNYDYVSYSVGANYRVSDDLAVFARHSRGGRANSDRLIFGSSINAAGVANEDAVVDFVRQTEIGVKYRNGPVQLYLTGFRSNTEETNFDFGLGFFSNRYRATGLEAEGQIRFGMFQLAAQGTYTDAEITSASASPALVGNRPRRQASFVYSISPSVEFDIARAGLNIVGTTKSFAQDTNLLELPGYTTFNGFISVRPTENIELSLNANNIFNVAGFTEAEEGSIPANGLIRARSINGRTVSASVRINF